MADKVQSSIQNSTPKTCHVPFLRQLEFWAIALPTPMASACVGGAIIGGAAGTVVAPGPGTIGGAAFGCSEAAIVGFVATPLASAVLYNELEANYCAKLP
jgi:hypothetical protein